MYPPPTPTSYPPGPSIPDQQNIDISGIPTSYDAERAERRKTQGSKSHNGRTSSWDILSGVRKIEQSYEEFDSRNASQAHLIYADGDIPKNKVRLIFFRRWKVDTNEHASSHDFIIFYSMCPSWRDGYCSLSPSSALSGFPASSRSQHFPMQRSVRRLHFRHLNHKSDGRYGVLNSSGGVSGWVSFGEVSPHYLSSFCLHPWQKQQDGGPRLRPRKRLSARNKRTLYNMKRSAVSYQLS